MNTNFNHLYQSKKIILGLTFQFFPLFRYLKEIGVTLLELLYSLKNMLAHLLEIQYL